MARFRPHLVAMDLTMPVMDGLEAMRRIRLMPGFAGVPIVATSASATQDVEQRARAAGAHAFIAKPIEQRLFLETIARLLNLRWVRRQAEPQAHAPDAEDANLVCPPAEEMAVLRQLARTANMRSTKAHADHLKRLDARYVPFATRLRTMAEGWQSNAITASVERYSEESDAG